MHPSRFLGRLPLSCPVKAFSLTVLIRGLQSPLYRPTGDFEHLRTDDAFPDGAPRGPLGAGIMAGADGSVPPLVFSCAGCKAILSDSTELVCSYERLGYIVVTGDMSSHWQSVNRFTYRFCSDHTLFCTQVGPTWRLKTDL